MPQKEVVAQMNEQKKMRAIQNSEECVSKWRNPTAHRMKQKHSRINDFADYRITVVTPVRTYTMTDRTEVPADFNKYWEG